ncbi:MAG TPA: O-acetyl-ADP-ribose deacetylase [Ktedonobacteraceae bacterium]|nr:O-acetyl-ADP-ribose deacetylase [Ktedonobacteraceae bacterium]
MRFGDVFTTTCTINGVTLALQQGDITKVEADAIVNAANSALAGGGGVDGAIHRAGGPSIMQECRQIGGCPTGGAVATGAGRLRAKYVFHAVGPIYHAAPEDARLLASAYQSCLNLAEQHQIESIAFPSLSTGAYGYPLSLAAPIALKTVIDHIQRPTSLKQATFVLLGENAYNAYEKALRKLMGNK